jgi:hypothetical protein
VTSYETQELSQFCTHPEEAFSLFSLTFELAVVLYFSCIVGDTVYDIVYTESQSRPVGCKFVGGVP